MRLLPRYASVIAMVLASSGVRLSIPDNLSPRRCERRAALPVYFPLPVNSCNAEDLGSGLAVTHSSLDHAAGPASARHWEIFTATPTGNGVSPILKAAPSCEIS
jgi:hypothetical protein